MIKKTCFDKPTVSFHSENRSLLQRMHLISQQAPVFSYRDKGFLPKETYLPKEEYEQVALAKLLCLCG